MSDLDTPPTVSVAVPLFNEEATIDELAEIVDVQPRDRKRFRKLLEESKNFESLPIRT